MQTKIILLNKIKNGSFLLFKQISNVKILAQNQQNSDIAIKKSNQSITKKAINTSFKPEDLFQTPDVLDSHSD